MKKNSKIKELALSVIKKEKIAVEKLESAVKHKSFYNLIELLLNSGKIILSGIGKSGIVAEKISATLRSTGTESIFIHPVEGLHGDIGNIKRNDAVIILSNSGETPEINKFAAILNKRKIKTVAVTNNPNSKLSKLAYITVNLHTPYEACPNNIVPTSSTTAMLVFGDVISIVLMKLKGIDKEKFAINHPGGNIGKLFYLKVKDIMRTGKDNPVIRYNARIKDAIKVMTETSLGATSIVDKNNRLIGFFTDGDLRRNFKKIKEEDLVSKHMTKNPVRINQDELAIKAAQIMQNKKIDNIPVVNSKDKVVGIVDERDLIREGII